MARSPGSRSPRRLLPSLLLLFLLPLFLGGCGAGSGGNENPYYSAERARYFTGTEGIDVRFDQLPTSLYYYANAPDSSANDFPMTVRVTNEGASYSRGAIFVSGYDPNLIQFDGYWVEGNYPGACSLRIGDYSLNSLGMILQCGDDFLWRGGEENWLESIMVHGRSWFDSGFLEDIRFTYHDNPDGQQFDFVFDDTTFSFDRRQHGLLLIGLLGGLSFSKFLGREYLLAGDTYEYPGGELEVLDYNGHILSWPEGVDDIPVDFMLTNCYLYTTFAAPIVCIDPQPYSETMKVCHPQVATWKNSQGAPVAITKVEQENTPLQAVFRISVRNVGGGTVYDPGQLEKCSPYFLGGAKVSDQDRVWLGDVRIGDYRLQCSPATNIRLDESGQATFTCLYPIEFAQINSAYQTPLVIELWYGYGETLRKRVMVKRVT